MRIASELFGWSLMAFSYAVARTSSSERCESDYQTKIVCFVSATNQRFCYDRLGASLCTHYILIDLAILNCEGNLLLVEQFMPALKSFLEFKTRLRRVGDTAKFLLAVGGANQESRDFSQAITGEDGALDLAKGIVDVVQQFGLDGVDIAWFTPGEGDDSKGNRINLVMLLRELRLQMAAGMSLSLTAVLEPEYFDVLSLDVYVDFVNLLTIDYHDPMKASHVAPLFSIDEGDQSTIFRSVKAFIKAGLNPQKIVVLTSTHGYLYTLNLCTADGEVAVKSVRKLSKYRVQEVLEREKFYVSWDDTRQVPYGTLAHGIAEKQWITFSDMESHRRKAQFVLKYQLGGIGVFTCDQEGEEDTVDTDGCSKGIPFPFLWAIVDTVRPKMKYENPPLIINDDMRVQYIPDKQCVSLENRKPGNRKIAPKVA